MYVLVAQSCLTLCDPMDCSPPGFSVHGILQVRILEWAVISFSRGIPNPGIKPGSPALQADSLPTEPPGNQLPVNILGMIYAESKVLVNLGCWPIAHILNQEYNMMLFSYCLTTLYSNQSMEVRVILSQLQTHS